MQEIPDALSRHGAAVMLLLTDPQWWLDRPDVLLEALYEADALEEYRRSGTLEIGDGRAEVRADRHTHPATGAVPDMDIPADVVGVAVPGWWTERQDEMHASLEIAVQHIRHREMPGDWLDVERQLREAPPPAPEREPPDHGHDRLWRLRSSATASRRQRNSSGSRALSRTKLYLVATSRI